MEPDVAVSPRDAADDVLQRSYDLLDLAEGRKSLAPSIVSDLARYALVGGVAAIDTYFHWAIRRVDLAGELPPELARIDVPYGELLTMGKRSVEARKAKSNDRPQTRARNVLNTALLRMTFQSRGAVERGFRMLGISDCWNKLAVEMVYSAVDVRARLDQIVWRRNLIAHEGDLVRQLRPQYIQREAIECKEVREHLDWIADFLDAASAIP